MIPRVVIVEEWKQMVLVNPMDISFVWHPLLKKVWPVSDSFSNLPWICLHPSHPQKIHTWGELGPSVNSMSYEDSARVEIRLRAYSQKLLFEMAFFVENSLLHTIWKMEVYSIIVLIFLYIILKLWGFGIQVVVDEVNVEYLLPFSRFIRSFYDCIPFIWC